ncbi:MAG: AMP-binding protein [Alphaproteobacteria bacterium]
MALGQQDSWPLARIEAAQAKHWRRQREHVGRDSAFYRRLWNGRQPPERLADLPELPLTSKQGLRDSQEAHPPFGDYLAQPIEAINRIHRTSGTTGRAVAMALSERDAAINAEAGGRSLRACGFGPGHIAVHCLNFQMWMGGLTDHMCMEATGAACIPFGVGASELLIHTVLGLKVTAIQCTPSYPAVLEQVLAERFPGIAPRALGLQIGVLTGEPGLENPAFRERVEATWGFKGRNAYGLSEAWSNIAGECDHDHAMHFVALDLLHHELIDPDSCQPLPWRQGTVGELVLTHLVKDCQPLVRFRTRDIIELTATETCACGRTGARFRVLGRSDDMIVVRGINVFPSAVAIVLNGFPELSGEFRIVLEGRGPLDRLPIEAELATGRIGPPRLADAIAAAIRERTGASAAVTLVPPASLPRTEGKAKRVVREPPA